jgi:hypothetical protein
MKLPMIFLSLSLHNSDKTVVNKGIKTLWDEKEYLINELRQIFELSPKETKKMEKEITAFKLISKEVKV